MMINEQTGSEPSTAFFSPARFSLTSQVPKYHTPLVKPIHGLISTFSPVGRFLNKPTQYISMRARVSVRVVPNMEQNSIFVDNYMHVAIDSQRYGTRGSECEACSIMNFSVSV